MQVKQRRLLLDQKREAKIATAVEEWEQKVKEHALSVKESAKEADREVATRGNIQLNYTRYVKHQGKLCRIRSASRKIMQDTSSIKENYAGYVKHQEKLCWIRGASTKPMRDT